MDIRKLLLRFDSLTEGSMARAKKKPTGPKFPGYLKGTDPASLTHSRMVGSSESQCFLVGVLLSGVLMGLRIA